jgi:uncharacterized protein YqgV (UPF0045/DUF77 family)
LKQFALRGRDPAVADDNLYRYCGDEPTEATDPSGMAGPTLVPKQEASPTKHRIVISYFIPFNGRNENTSKTVATIVKTILDERIRELTQAFGTHLEVSLAEVAVAPGEPAKIINQEKGKARLCGQVIDLWLGLGEDQAGGPARIETQVGDLKLKDDNEIMHRFVESLKQAFPAPSNPGTFICAEMAHDLMGPHDVDLRAGVFIHVPALNSRILVQAAIAREGATQIADALSWAIAPYCGISNTQKGRFVFEGPETTSPW